MQSDMELQTEPIVFQEEVMIPVQFANGGFDFNQELIPTVRLAVAALGLTSVEDLKAVSQEQFSAVFTPLMNDYYCLS